MPIIPRAGIFFPFFFRSSPISLLSSPRLVKLDLLLTHEHLFIYFTEITEISTTGTKAPLAKTHQFKLTSIIHPSSEYQKPPFISLYLSISVYLYLSSGIHNSSLAPAPNPILPTLRQSRTKRRRKGRRKERKPRGKNVAPPKQGTNERTCVMEGKSRPVPRLSRARGREEGRGREARKQITRNQSINQ